MGPHTQNVRQHGPGDEVQPFKANFPFLGSRSELHCEYDGPYLDLKTMLLPSRFPFDQQLGGR